MIVVAPRNMFEFGVWGYTGNTMRPISFDACHDEECGKKENSGKWCHRHWIRFKIVKSIIDE